MGFFSTKTPQHRTVEDMEKVCGDVIAFRNQQFINGFNLIWNNPYGLSPQEAMDAFGIEAASLLAKSQKEKADINAQADADVCTVAAPCDFQVNPDGTVTLVFPPPAAPTDQEEQPDGD